MVLSKKGFVPKHTKHYNKETVERAQSIFMPDSNSQVTTDLSVSIQFWMRKRGQSVQNPMTDVQKRQLRECFEVIDTDGSGSLDARELFGVFEAMGIKANRAQILELIKEVDDDGSGEIEFPEFMQIMHKQMFERDPHESIWKEDIYTEEDRMAGKAGGVESKKEEPKKENLMPLHLLAGAYRRKKVLEAVMHNQGDMRKRLIASGHEFKQKRKQEAKAAEVLTKESGQVWKSKTQTRKIVADRLSDSDEVKVDVMHPSATATPKQTPRQGGEEGGEASQAPSGGGRGPAEGRRTDGGGSDAPIPRGESPPAGAKILRDMWGSVGENRKLNDMVGAAMVVKRDLHRRAELRERLEGLNRRPSAFDDNDRQKYSLKKDAITRQVENDEMRSLALAGVTPRIREAPDPPEATGGFDPLVGTFQDTADRPSTVPTRFGPGGAVSRMGASMGAGPGLGLGRDRPATVPAGMPRGFSPGLISEALAYKPVPDSVEPCEDWTLTLNDDSKGDEDSPRRSATNSRQSHQSTGTTRSRPWAHKSPTRASTHQGHRPQTQHQIERNRSAGTPQGRDLLVQRRRDKDAAIRRHAVSREKTGTAFDRIRSPVDERRNANRASDHCRRGSTAGSTRSAYGLGPPMSAPMTPPARTLPLGPLPSGSPYGADFPEEGIGEHVQTAWVSPYTGRISTPITRNRGLALDVAVGARAFAVPKPGVPIWKVSEQGLLDRPTPARHVKTIALGEDFAPSGPTSPKQTGLQGTLGWSKSGKYSGKRSPPAAARAK